MLLIEKLQVLQNSIEIPMKFENAVSLQTKSLKVLFYWIFYFVTDVIDTFINTRVVFK